MKVATSYPSALLPQQFLVRRTRLEDHVAAGNERFDRGKAERFKFAPQALHLNDPPTDIDRAEESEISRQTDPRLTTVSAAVAPSTRAKAVSPRRWATP